MTIIGARKISYVFSGILAIASITALSLWGLNLGIDFTGGSLLEIEYKETRMASNEIEERLETLALGEVLIQQTGERGAILRMKNIDEETHQAVLGALVTNNDDIIEKRFDSIGPTIGSELKRKAIIALLLVVVMIVLYIAWAFRHVSEPVQSWKYGLVAIVALVHDVLIAAGVFAYLGHFYGIEVNALFITALLTILGFSVHDTIVMFDRVRENLKRDAGELFEVTVNGSVKQNITRSVNTSLTLLFVLLALLFFGSESTRFFALALAIGTIFGTYSSIFIASPLLVTWQKWSVKH